MSPHEPLPARALALGTLVGALLAVSSVYGALKTGFADSGNITASLVGFALVAVTHRLGGRRGTPEETLTIQTFATAMGGAALVASIDVLVPALALAGAQVAPLGITAWCATMAAFALVVVAPLRHRALMDDRLRFPTSVATAELVTALHSGVFDRGRFKAFTGAGVVASAVTWLRDGVAGALPAVVRAPGAIGGTPLASLTFGLGVSPLMVGLGLLIGPRVALSMAAGSVIGWGALAPALLQRRVVESAEFSSLVAWLVWPATGVIVGATLVSVARTRREVARGLASPRTDDRTPRLDRRFVVALSGVLALGVLLVAWVVFRASPLLAATGVALAWLAAAVSLRAAGETDIVPAGNMQQIMQAASSVLRPPSAPGALVAGAVVSGVGTQAAWALWSLRTARLLGLSSERQWRIFIAGSLVGSLVAAPAYLLLARAYGIGTEALPVPSAQVARALVDALSAGATSLPAGAASALGVGTLLGALAAAAEGRKLAPSPIAVAVGMLAPASYAAGAVLGALAALALSHRWKGSHSERTAALGGGLIVGESVGAVTVALARAVGLLGGV